MLVKRCAIVVLEPRETVSYTLESLLRGGNGLDHSMQWFALAPHLDARWQCQKLSGRCWVS